MEKHKTIKKKKITNMNKFQNNKIDTPFRTPPSGSGIPSGTHDSELVHEKINFGLMEMNNKTPIKNSTNKEMNK